MIFRFTDEQLLFASTVREILTRECTPAQVRNAQEEGRGTIPRLWETLASTGVVGLTAPVPAGGLGLGQLDLVLIMEEVGRACCPELLLEHVALAVPLLAGVGTDSQRGDWLEPAATGQVRLTGTLASPLVLGADQADALVLRSGGDLHLVPAAEVNLTLHRTVDATRRMFTVEWSPSASTRMCADGSHVRAALDQAAVAAAAQCVGVAQRLLELTVEYVLAREQFGRPVGANQAIKHHLANISLGIEFARPLTYRAAWALTNSTPDRSVAASMAKLVASNAVDTACRLSLQSHGAIAYTVEHDLQLWLKRGWALAAAWGAASGHRDAIGRNLERRLKDAS